MRVLGIDPGTLHLGFGIIEIKAGGKPGYVTCGVVDMPGKLNIGARLRLLQRDLEILFDKYAPDIMGLENIFVGVNARAAIRIGEARAVALLTAAHYDTTVLELPPATVKQLVTGQGRAGKLQVQKMITLLLQLNQPPRSPDAADALAVAIAAGYRALAGKAG